MAQRRSFALLILFILLATPFVGNALAQSRAGGAVHRLAQAKANGNEFVGSQACVACHRGISETFSQTDMGRSMSLITPSLLEKLPLPISVPQPQNPNRHLEVYARDKKLYQSEYETDADHAEIFRDTHEIEWIIGSGANGFGGILGKNNYLFQGPLSFYSKPQSWGPSPGYEIADLAFNRPILPGCIACHSGRPKPITEGNGRFEEPPFAELAIGCENCHGPGRSHVLARQRNLAREEPDPSIVNPARLAPVLADNICMYCHQVGDIRVLQPGKDYRDFRPGIPLDDVLGIFMAPPRPESPPQADHLEHYYSMSLSKCYRASGRMSCISCHDPHVQPSREEAPLYFAKKCLTCHTEKSCSLPLSVRQHADPPDACPSCHMAKRDVQVISHSSLTNHRILVRPDEPFPGVAFHQTTAALPDLVHLNPAPGRQGAMPPLLTLLQVYGELLDTKPEYSARYLAVLDELERTQAGNSLVQTALGRRDLRAGRLSQAAAHLQRALDIGPPRAATYADLAEALVQLDRPADALPLLQNAIDLDPFNAALQKTRVLRLIQLKRYPEAEAAMEQYVERFPEDSFMRQMLARAKSAEAPK